MDRHNQTVARPTNFQVECPPKLSAAKILLSVLEIDLFLCVSLKTMKLTNYLKNTPLEPKNAGDEKRVKMARKVPQLATKPKMTSERSRFFPERQYEQERDTVFFRRTRNSFTSANEIPTDPRLRSRSFRRLAGKETKRSREEH